MLRAIGLKQGKAYACWRKVAFSMITEGFTDKVVMGAGIEKVRVPERRKAKKESPKVTRGDRGGTGWVRGVEEKRRSGTPMQAGSSYGV